MAVKITELINIEFIQELQNELSEISGMAILTTDPKGIPITKGSNFTDFCAKYTRKKLLVFRAFWMSELLIRNYGPME